MNCVMYIMWLNTWKGTSCLKRSKLTFLLFPTWLFFQLSFGAKCMKSDIVFLRYLIGDVIWDWWKVKKKAKKFGICKKVSVFWQFTSSFLHVFAPKPSSNLNTKYWRFQNIWNLKIYSGAIFWDILTLICIPTTQNPVFQQLVPFDMLSHI